MSRKFNFFIIYEYYKDVLDFILKNNIHFCDYDFNLQMKITLDLKFGLADFYSSNLINMGHNAIDIINNFEVAQKKWFKTIGEPFLIKNKILNKYSQLSSEEDWKTKILETQILFYKPDIIYNFALSAVSPDFMKSIKQKFPFVKMIIGQHSSIIRDNMKDLSAYDLILSSLPNQVAYFNQMGIKSEFFKLGFEETILTDIEKNNHYQFDVTHVGGYGPIHSERNILLEYLAENLHIDFFGYGIHNLSEFSPIRKNYKGNAWGLEMYRIRAKSKIVVTKHIEKVADCNANNMTMYETTGLGALLIVDEKRNIQELFQPGKEIVTYNSPSDCVQKIKYFLSHENERKKIAKAGQIRTLKENTFSRRMKDLILIINKHLYFCDS